MPAHDTLASLKRVYDTLEKNEEVSPRRIKKSLKRAISAIEILSRHAHDVKMRAEIDLQLIKLELNRELVDREANAARRDERQITLFERGQNTAERLTAYNRSAPSAGFVEASLASLCPHRAPIANGCAVLANKK